MPDLAAIGRTRATLWNCGYRPIPLLSYTDPDKTKAGKAPLHKDWPSRARCNPPEGANAPALAHLANTGILADGLRSVDVDVDHRARADAIEDLAISMLGPAPTRRRSNSPRFCMLYRAADGAPGKRRLIGTTGDPEHPDQIEVLGKGQQFVAYGTHVTGSEIYWTGPEPLDLPLDKLPVVTEEQITAFLVKCAEIIGAPDPAIPRANGDGRHHASAAPADLHLLAQALAVIPPAIANDYDAWIRIGCAVHHATDGHEAARDLWDGWSAQSPKYNADEIAKRWASFASAGLGASVGAGTIFHLARQHGWTPPQHELPPGWEAQHPPVGAIEPTKRTRRKAAEAPDADATPPEFSENALAYLFTARHGGSLLYVHEWATWLRWEGNRWRQDHTVAVFDKARVICAEQGAIAATLLKRSGAKIASAINKAATVGAIERLARHHHRHVKPADDFDADPLLLNASSTASRSEPGAMVVRKQRREDYCTKQATVDPDLGADCPLWRTFLLRVMDTDQDMVDYLQRVCGYCLTGLTTEHVLFFAHGTGANGKSTFANVLTSILGTGPSGYAAIAPISTFTASHTDQHPTDLAMLRGARLVVAQETEESRSWAISRIKMMTGGDLIAARFMRQDFFTYAPQFKLLILGNHKPALHNVDEATRRRFHLIPFTVTIPEAERDPKLAEKLTAEHPAILGWMMRGFQEWHRIGLAPPPQVRAASAAYFADEDTVAAWIAECCDVGGAFYDTLIALYPSWKAWAEAHGEKPGSAKELAKALDARPELIRHNQPGTKRAGWRGLTVKPPPRRWNDAP